MIIAAGLRGACSWFIVIRLSMSIQWSVKSVRILHISQENDLWPLQKAESAIADFVRRILIMIQSWLHLSDVGSKVQFFFFFFLYCSVAEPGLNPESIWGCQSSLKRATFFYPLPLFLLITTPKWQVSHSCRLSLIKDFFWLLTTKHCSEKKKSLKK